MKNDENTKSEYETNKFFDNFYSEKYQPLKNLKKNMDKCEVSDYLGTVLMDECRIKEWGDPLN